jgi:hypothetical protein
MPRKYPLTLVGLLAILVMVTTAAAPGGANNSGFKTAQPLLHRLTGVTSPLLTVRRAPKRFPIEAVPDVFTLRPGKGGRLGVTRPKFISLQYSKPL